MRKLKLKIKNNDPDYIAETYTLLNSFIIDRGYGVRIWDFRDFQKSIAKAENVINIIFIIVIIIVMFLSFFSLVSSMTANILEQTKEISVLRSIGIPKRNMILLYIYEAFVLVFASSFTGLIIGTIIGFTMSMQRALFTQLPIQFEFPLTSFLIILIVSIIVAFLSTFFPSLRVLKKEISVIMKLQS
jgi:ABC-type antimicrobial peptide transport system permease subunit